MRKNHILIALLFLPTLIGACIFQSDPLGPNSVPVIRSFAPEETYISGFMVNDSMIFRIHATDPDGDHVDYSFSVNGTEVNQTDTLLFHPLEEGEYVVAGIARDGGSSASRVWTVNVSGRPNEPPLITSYEPDQQVIACVLGGSLHFSLTVSDDDPQSLRYSYVLNGDPVAQYLDDSSFEFRFMENGQHLFHGIVFDGQYSDTTTWHLSVEGIPDTICPSAITDLAGAPGETWGSIHLTWTAPGDDSTWGSAASYHVRTSVYPIITESDWEFAEGKQGEPVPSPSGTPEEATITRLNPGTYLWAAVRAQDDFFNWSPLGNCILVQVRGADFEGFVIDACSGEPIEGNTVSSNGHSATSGQDGHYLIENLTIDASKLRSKDELVTGEIGEYYDCEMPITIAGIENYVDVYNLPALELVNTNTDYYQDRFWLFFVNITYATVEPVLKTWRRYPLRVYSPPMVFKDVDLQAGALGAMDEWESMTGLDLFEIVENPDSADVRICYNDSIVDSHEVETIEENPDGTPKLKTITIFLLYENVPINLSTHLVFAHEFGHILCLVHSRDNGHLMLGYGSLPDQWHVTEDEANVVKIMYHLPFIYDVSCIKEE